MSRRLPAAVARFLSLPLLLGLLALHASGSYAAPPAPFGIQIVDADTGRGIPLVELETTSHVRYVTDSQGWVAIDEPDLMGRRVHFQIRSHGYSFPADGFGIRGRAVELEPGGRVRWQMQRDQPAERLYRLTGSGIYADSLQLDEPVPLEHPLGNARVWGCDSVLSIPYRDRIYWFWGDTVRPEYPLGNFHVTGATSRRPDQGGLAPDVGVDYDYFTRPDGFVRSVAKMPGEGPTWLGALALVDDDQGTPRLVAGYVKIRNRLEVYRRGIVQWNEDRQAFEHLADLEEGLAFYPTTQNHPVRIRAAAETEPAERDLLYFATPLPWVRVPATLEAYRDPRQYEAYTCLKDGTRVADQQLDRDATGRLRYAWRKNTPPLLAPDEARLVEAGVLKESERRAHFTDPATGRRVQPHGGSVAWNPFRRRWILVFVEAGGEHSYLGDVWYAEADRLEGPWQYATRIASHQHYSFYNPKHHAFFDQDGGRRIYFEGTYTQTFSRAKTPTPRYDYNQLMYRLDLDDPRVRHPVAVYEHQGEFQTGVAASEGRVRFFAWDRSLDGAIPVYQAENPDGTWRLTTAHGNVPSETKPAFYALPTGMDDPPSMTGALVGWRDPQTGRIRYGLASEVPARAKRLEEVCRVWPGR